jgi:hypothetical protein
VKIGAKDGGTRDGWVCEQDHPLVRMCGPWDWPGFELVDNSSIKPVDMLKRYIHVAEQFLADEDKTEFETSAARSTQARSSRSSRRRLTRITTGK